jgi:predicted  nucleic acid-binding Zn-ribbon protein
MIEEKSKSLRTMTINLEPHHKEIQEEINKIEVEVERITTAYNLGEITEEEYVKTSGPPQQRLAELRERIAEMEEIFDFLKKPLGAEYV